MVATILISACCEAGPGRTLLRIFQACSLLEPSLMLRCLWCFQLPGYRQLLPDPVDCSGAYPDVVIRHLLSMHDSL